MESKNFQPLEAWMYWEGRTSCSILGRTTRYRNARDPNHQTRYESLYNAHCVLPEIHHTRNNVYFVDLYMIFVDAPAWPWMVLSCFALDHTKNASTFGQLYSTLSVACAESLMFLSFLAPHIVVSVLFFSWKKNRNFHVRIFKIVYKIRKSGVCVCTYVLAFKNWNVYFSSTTR